MKYKKEITTLQYVYKFFFRESKAVQNNNDMKTTESSFSILINLYIHNILSDNNNLHNIRKNE